jgi:hemolysin III
LSVSLAVHRREQTRAEEIANSVSHGIGLIAAIVVAPFLILDAARFGDAGYIVGTSLFAVTVVMLYLSSTLYHVLPKGKTKRLLRVFDHSTIYLLIAGTYSPFTLGVLKGTWGWTLFVLVWVLAITGITLKAFNWLSHPIVSTSLYLFMGWLILIAIKPLYESVPIPGIFWIVAGGVAYTAGVVFFAVDSRLRYGHFIWHLFVITGTACHYFAVLRYAA